MTSLFPSTSFQAWTAPHEYDAKAVEWAKERVALSPSEKLTELRTYFYGTDPTPEFVEAVADVWKGCGHHEVVREYVAEHSGMSIPDPKEVEAAMLRYVALLQAQEDKHIAEHFDNLRPSKIGYRTGRKYWKITRTTDAGEGQTSVRGFVRRHDGAIFKAKSWKAPALNYVRGNVLDEHNGMAYSGVYGMTYCR